MCSAKTGIVDGQLTAHLVGLLKSLRHFVANSADCAGFADPSD
jgi:hypothetical protein